MTVKELISINQCITDICIEVRVDGMALLDALHIGLDYGVEPPHPLMVPKARKYIGNQGMESKRKSAYIRKSINAWDDGRDYWQVKPDRLPKGWLELEVFSWSSRHVFKRHHPRSSGNPSDSYEGIRIVALPFGDVLPEPVKLKKETELEGQINLFEGVD